MCVLPPSSPLPNCPNPDPSNIPQQGHIHKAEITISKLKWSRIPVAGAPHKHSFVRNGDDKRFTFVNVQDTNGDKKALKATVSSGIKDLLVLKTTESSFENFVRDEYTTVCSPFQGLLGHLILTCRIFGITSYPKSATGFLAPPWIVPTTRISALTSISPIPLLSIRSKSISMPSVRLPFLPLPSLHTPLFNSDSFGLTPTVRSVETTTLEVFATHNSASVQATLYKMCERILAENAVVSEVTYKLPNKVGFLAPV